LILLMRAVLTSLLCLILPLPALAAGQILTQPVPQPSTPPPPSTLPTPPRHISAPPTLLPTPSIETIEGTPISPVPIAPGTAVSPAAPSKGEPLAPVKGTIEYVTGYPNRPEGGITIPEALNEALMKSPRSAAIRSQLPIAQANIVQAA